MKLSLPLRIVAVHLAFTVVLAGFGAWLVKRSFDRYADRWRDELAVVPAERLFSPLASELARSLLLRLETDSGEQEASIRQSVGDALDRVLPTLPSVERLIVLDQGLSVEYTSEPITSGSDDVSASPETLRALAATDRPLRRSVRLASGASGVEVVRPIRSSQSGERLGVAVARFRDAASGESGEGDAAAELTPWVDRVARSLLEESGDPAAARAAVRREVSDGLSRLISRLPLETLLVVDAERRIQYVNDPMYLDLRFTGGQLKTLFASPRTVRRPVELAPGEPGLEVMIPIYDLGTGGAAATEGRRLGSVLLRVRPDPELARRIPELQPPEVGPREFLAPLLLFFVVTVLSGFALAMMTGLPVRRLERALDDFRRRGYRGGIDTTGASLPSDLESTVRAISELGGAVEALDARGEERRVLLDTLSQSLEDGLLALGADGVPIATNPAARRLLLGDDPVAGDDVETALLRAFECNPDLRFAAEHAPPGVPREIRIVQPNGRHAVARVTRVPVPGDRGRGSVLVLLRDLDALRRVEAHLLDTGRFAVLAHLAAGLAHEIRNPLHAIQLNAGVVEQYAGRAGKDAVAVRESISTVKDEAQRLTDLLNNYLGLVRPGDGEEPVDLRDLARKVIQLVRYTAVKSGVEVRLDGAENLPMVRGHAGRLQQAILNLVLNAIQAMPDGGAVTIRTEASDTTVRLSVSDTGPGLPPQLADRLFDTRVTTKPEGSGLGLPLVRLIVEAHGGGVWYHAARGEGASFTLAFPVAGAARDATGAVVAE